MESRETTHGVCRGYPRGSPGPLHPTTGVHPSFCDSYQVLCCLRLRFTPTSSTFSPFVPEPPVPVLTVTLEGGRV